MWALVMSMPLPGSVRRAAIEPTIVTSRPSRIQTVPRPMTTRQWNLVHGRRSRRAGTSVRIVLKRRAAAPAAWAVLDTERARPIAWDDGAVGLPRARSPLSLHERRVDHALGLPARLRRQRLQALRHRGRGGPLRPRLRSRGWARPRPARAGRV